MLLYIAITGYLTGIIVLFAFMWGSSGRHNLNPGHASPVLPRHAGLAAKEQRLGEDTGSPPA